MDGIYADFTWWNEEPSSTLNSELKTLVDEHKWLKIWSKCYIEI